jgi:signal transduction histidine kinase
VSRLLAIRSKSLRQIQADLDDARQIKTDFLSNVSHEIPTPMTGRPSEICNADFDVSQVIAELAVEYEAWAGSKEIRFEADVPATSVYSDRSRTTQALHHLFDNAIKFTHTVGVQVSVRPSDNGFVEIRIVETGPGIPSNQSARIFDRFFQIQDDQNITPGSGLGLSITGEFTDLIGGRIWLESASSEGGVFALALPTNAEVIGEATDGNAFRRQICQVLVCEPQYRDL